jgi:hypothetical protein
MKPLFFAVLGAAGLSVSAQTSPTLFVERTAPQSLRMIWTNTASGFALEQSDSLGAGALWQSVTTPPTETGNEFSIVIAAAAAEQFFRLRSVGLTTITEISPLDGETGVAVTRETIIHFSAPLSADTVLTPQDFYAGYGGRRLLTRVELSSDRTKATLFYLEPMPGSTRITVVLDGDDLLDQWRQPLDLDNDGLSGGSALLTFDTLNTTALAGTGVTGQVFASELMPGSDTGTNAVNRPLEGVIITVDGKEQELRTTTDAQGKFTLTPAPSGRFFVKIDGRTAKGSQWPNGAYYPYVGKAWEALAGKTNNLAGGTGEIFLPLIGAGTLQPVSATQDTTISFPASVVAENPALNGVFVTVPANSLFNDNGTRGGKVGIAPVPPDRLPGPLPPGLEVPIVITVQTDGALNFDQPAPVCFPNLIDPVLGTLLPAGTKQSLISFDHKKGLWEAVGTMTVSADGKLICTDPGSGILQPGWHTVGPQPEGPPPPPCGGGGGPEIASRSPGVGRIIALQTQVECIADCESARKKSDEEDENHINRSLYLCHKNDCSSRDIIRLLKLREDLREITSREYDRCVAKCKEIPPPKIPPNPYVCRPKKKPGRKSIEVTLIHALARETSLETVQKILSAIDQIQIVTAAYLDSTDPWPEAIVKTVSDLFANANTLAGGDAAEYLNAYYLDLEIRAAAAGTLEEPDGNAPEYPVLYVAEILRPSGSFFIRGATQPFGQYQLFVPRDGKILSVRFYDPKTASFDIVYPRLRPDAPWRLPSFELFPLDETARDSDHDGLADIVETVYGSDPDNPDSDGDGIRDGAEIEQGTNLLDGRVAQTGLIATAKTPGAAVDVTAGNDLIVTAEGPAGISIFRAYTGDNPVIIAHVPTPGNAQRVAVGGNFVAVAQPDFGFSIIDVSRPEAASIIHQLPLIGAQAVVMAGETAYAAAGALIVTVDLRTGRLIPTYLSKTVRDLALNGRYLYALSENELTTFSVDKGTLTPLSSVPSPFFEKANERLFVGDGLGYAIHSGGYNPFDLSVPSAPVLIKAGRTTAGGWKQIVSNGSGLGVAAVGPNATFDFAQNVSLYDLSSPTNINVPITSFPTPGHAQSVVLWKGLAYVADLAAGLQVINYLPYDTKGVAPKIVLNPGFDANGTTAGSRIFVAANATDDVQVRSVEFYLDGTNTATDGNFPFEYRLVVPALTATKTNFTLRARAFDTGGNSTWSETIDVKLLPETTEIAPPVVTFTTPVGGGHTITNLVAYFSKGLDPDSVNSASFQLFAAGPDEVFGTPDDLPISSGLVSYREFGHKAILAFPTALPLGKYRAVLGTAIRDFSGRNLAAAYRWDFQVADATFWVNFGDGAWDVPWNWDTGVVPAASNNVVINFPVTVTLRNSITVGKTVSGVEGSKLYVPYFTSATFDGLTLNTDLLLDPNVGVQVTNGLTVNRALTMPGGQNFAQLKFYGNQTLGGRGQVLFTGTYISIVQPIVGTLTIGSDLTIRGTGVVGNPNLPLVNLGTLVADGSVPNSSMTVTGSSVDNRGTLRSLKNGHLIANNLVNHGVIDLPGGSLDLIGTTKSDDIGAFTGNGGAINIVGTLDNRNSLWKLDAESPSWQLAGGTLLGGVVTTAGGAQLVVSYFGGTLDETRIEGDLHVLANAYLRVRNGLTLNGTATVDTGPNGVSLNFDGAQTFDGTGQVLLPLGGEFTAVRPINGLLTIGPGLTIRGSGVIGHPNLPLINQGTIRAENGRTMQIFGSAVTNTGTLQATGATLLVDNLENQGQLVSSAAGTMTLNKNWRNVGTIGVTNAVVNLGGAFSTPDIGSVRPNNATVNITGVLDNRNSTLMLDSPGWQLTEGTILGGTINSGTGMALSASGRRYPTFDGVILDMDLTLPGNAYVRVTNGLTLNKTATLNGGGEGTTLNFDGTQTFGGSGELLFVGFPSTLIQPLNGSLTIGPGLTIRGGSGTVGNNANPLTIQGTVIADGATAAIHLLGNPINIPGATTEVNGGQILVGR